MTVCVILGDKSDIASALRPLMIQDDWHVAGWNRYTPGVANMPHWDVCLIAIGQVKPVGPWWQQDAYEWDSAVESNILLPVKLLRRIWGKRKPGASVAFMAGSNPNLVMPNYTAYATGKMALLKAVEHMDYETPDAKMFALGPGTVLTKIHNATRASGVSNPRLAQADKDGGTPIERIWSCLRWCIRQPKSVVGGRNICVSDSPDWDKEVLLANRLKDAPALFKLRRVE